MNRPLPQDPVLAEWMLDLRSETIAAIPDDSVAVLAGALAAAGAAGAVATAIQGGTTMMTSTTVGATAAAGVKAKLAAAGLAAALAAGGAAAVTGNLPDGAQAVAADVAARVGISLPAPETDVSAKVSVGAATEATVQLSGLGSIDLAVDGNLFAVTSIDAGSGLDARVVSRTRDSAVVEFRGNGEITTVVLTMVDGRIVTSTSSKPLDVGVDLGTELDLDAEVGSDGGGGAGTEAEIDADISIDLGS